MSGPDILDRYQNITDIFQMEPNFRELMAPNRSQAPTIQKIVPKSAWFKFPC